MSKIEPSPEEYARMGQTLVAEAKRRDRVALIGRRVVIGAAGAILAGSAMGAAWIALASAELRTNAAYCYGEPDQNSKYVGVGAPAAEAPDGTLLLRDEDPIDLCAAVWRIGAVGPHATQPPVNGVYYDVPELTACLRLDGVTAVFPNEGREAADAFCRDLGLAPFGR